MPVSTINDEDSKNSDDNCETDNSPMNANGEEDTVVNVPMRLSMIRELYNLFGTLLEQYSDT